MGFIGKLLVVVHAAASLSVLGWAVGVFTHRIDWNTPKVDAGKEAAPGLFDRQKAEADKYTAGVDKSYTRWSGNLSQVELLERERYPRRAFYAAELHRIRTGKVNVNGKEIDVRDDPVRVMVNAPNGYLNIDPNAPRQAVEIRPGFKANSMAGYDRLTTKLVEDIQASQAQNARAIAEREKLNDDIIGHTQPTLKKGLRTLLAEQQGFKDRADREEMYVIGFVTNREAEFGLLKKRRDAMEDRKKEMEGSK